MSTSCTCDQAQREEDMFDLLPDAILQEIFNRVHDANSLVNCITTCKRFASLIPSTHVIHLTLPSPSSTKQFTPRKFTSSTNQVIKSFINKIIIKPIQTLLHILKKSCNSDIPVYLPNEILKNFNEIKSLRVELPKNRGDISSNNKGDAFLKWKAEFGSELQSCVILAANSKVENNTGISQSLKDEEDMSTSTCFTNDMLKLRVVWTISCLIAASARHHLMKQILSQHLTVRDVEMIDGSKQGKICMQKGQVEELRNAMKCREEGDQTEMGRTKVPALKMKMWYMQQLELPGSAYVLKGATLMVITPVDVDKSGGENMEKSDGEMVMSAFDGDEEWIGEAAKNLIKKKRAFTLEMNSF